MAKAQEELYLRYADKMFRTAFRYIHSQADAEDVLVISFTKVFTKMQGFVYQGKNSLEAWIRKIVINESLMWLRQRHNFHLTKTIDAVMTEPDLSAFSKLDEEDIYQCITRLPTGYRTVFNLFIIEGYSHQEIASQLGISENTSRSQLFKAKALLRKMLQQDGLEYGT